MYGMFVKQTRIQKDHSSFRTPEDLGDLAPPSLKSWNYARLDFQERA